MTVKNGWDVAFKGWCISATCNMMSAHYSIAFVKCNATLNASGLYEENGPPTDIADRINASFPHWMAMELNRRKTQTISELDKYTYILLPLSFHFTHSRL